MQITFFFLFLFFFSFFGQKSGQDLKNRAPHPHQEFPGVPPSPGLGRVLVCGSSIRDVDIMYP